MRSLNVFIDQRRVGTLLEGDDLWVFEYDPQWATAVDGYDLCPALSRNVLRHQDGATLRPVQWFFDNLLPEELLRTAILKEAGIKGHDAFALLDYLGAESAGSLTLLPPGNEPAQTGRLLDLSDGALSERIAAMPAETLTRKAPKRMSLAGAQHKLLVVLQDGKLFEPEGATPSTHILKPNHPDTGAYPVSVFNEYITMCLARALGLDVPQVMLRYVPQPVYIIERFDRVAISPSTKPMARRRHIIDACQLLNRPAGFKHSGATLATLLEVVQATTNKARTRLRLFSWLVFNVLVGNDDCHLKNLSFYVDADGIALAPHYDLLSTCAYHTRAFADEHASWPTVPMAYALPDAALFGQVTLDKMLAAARELGVPERPAKRTIAAMAGKLMPALVQLKDEFEASRAQLPAVVGPSLAAQTRLLSVLENITYPDMLARLRD